MKRAPSKERKELFCGTREECAWHVGQCSERDRARMEIVNNATGPAFFAPEAEFPNMPEA